MYSPSTFMAEELTMYKYPELYLSYPPMPAIKQDYLPTTLCYKEPMIPFFDMTFLTTSSLGSPVETMYEENLYSPVNTMYEEDLFFPVDTLHKEDFYSPVNTLHKEDLYSPVNTLHEYSCSPCSWIEPATVKKSKRAIKDRPFVCQLCHRAFTRKHDLQRHIRVHTGDKPYSCPCCKKAFARTDALKRHLRMEIECSASHEVQIMKKNKHHRTLNC